MAADADAKKKAAEEKKAAAEAKKQAAAEEKAKKAEEKKKLAEEKKKLAEEKKAAKAAEAQAKKDAKASKKDDSKKADEKTDGTDVNPVETRKSVMDPTSIKYDPALKYFNVVVGKDTQKLALRFVKTEIVQIIPGGWAESQGLEIDDEIWAVAKGDCNDEDFDFGSFKGFLEMSEEERVKALTQEKPLTIKIKRPEIKDSYMNFECHEKKLGLKYIRTTITSVTAGSWADQNKIEPGDQLIMVNDRLFESLSEDEILKILTGPRPLRMQFKRPAKEHKDQDAIEDKEHWHGLGESQQLATIAADEAAAAGKENTALNEKAAAATAALAANGNANGNDSDHAGDALLEKALAQKAASNPQLAAHVEAEKSQKITKTQAGAPEGGLFDMLFGCCQVQKAAPVQVQ